MQPILLMLLLLLVMLDEWRGKCLEVGSFRSANMQLCHILKQLTHTIGKQANLNHYRSSLNTLRFSIEEALFLQGIEVILAVLRMILLNIHHDLRPSSFPKNFPHKAFSPQLETIIDVGGVTVEERYIPQ